MNNPDPSTFWCETASWEGRWDAGSIIGAGKDCTVYLSRRCGQADAEEVLLKVLRAGRDGNAAWNLAKEARALEAFDHPRIPRMMETNLTPNAKYRERTPYLVVEHVPGITLREHVDAHGPLGDEATLAMADALLDAVAHCHERGWIHGDLRPANVVVRNGNPRDPILIDFKSSKDLRAPSSRTGSLTPLGAPRGPASDLTQVACMLLFGITGNQPHGLRDVHLRAPHEMNWGKGGLHGLEGERVARLWSLFDRAFTLQVEERFHSAAELQAALRHARAAPPILAKPSSTKKAPPTMPAAAPVTVEVFHA